MNIELTIYGEKHSDGKEEYFLEMEKGIELNPKMKDEHHKAMLDFFKVIQSFSALKRSLPVMESEMRTLGLPAKPIRDLIKFGYLKKTTAPLRNKGTGKSLGVRNFVYWTPAGRAYVKQFIKVEGSNGSGESNTGITVNSGRVQPEVQQVDGTNGVHGELPVEVRDEGQRQEVPGNTDNRSDSIQE